MVTNQFSWSQNWYPISPLSYLDASVPSTITVLGKKLVIWQNKKQQWVVMDDQCPHKLAQLSLGKIQEDGTLMCRHHGWCFNDQGNCTKIPMLVEEEAIKTACNSPRSKVTVYPTQVKQGLLWVWPDDKETAFQDCQLKDPAIIPECGLDVSATDWRLSEVPVSYTVSLESSFDPSHAQFLHEGLAGFSPERAIPINSFKTVGEISLEAGFTLEHSGYNIFNKDMKATRKFSPPCCTTTIYRYPNGNMMLAQLYFIPTEPGRCRYITKFISTINFSQKNFIVERLPQKFKTAFSHLRSYQLTDQDLTVMHSQETLQATLDKPWNKRYFLPTNADVGIITFRQWLDQFAGGKPAWKNGEETAYQPLTKEQLYDRWNRHTKYCPSCRATVELLGKVEKYSRYSMMIFAILTLVLLILPVSNEFAILSTIFAIITVFTAFIAGDLSHSFMSGLPKRGLLERKLYADVARIPSSSKS
ncbi:MAG: Rieske 2Fe-2S domain-containing protein [Crocosphaera sp.]